MSLHGFLSVHDDALLLSIKVQPRARRNELAGTLGSELKVRVTAPPVDSAANEGSWDSSPRPSVSHSDRSPSSADGRRPTR